VGDPDPRTLNLDVYDTKEGLWNPEHGPLALPTGWEFLPTGDAFVTRRVKASGTYWIVWRPRGSNRPHRRKLGLFAPTAAINDARADPERSTARRARQRELNTRHRDKVEDAYRSEFAAAVQAWLDFTSEHSALAEEIATAAAERAVVVGSGRVGRTKLLPLEERASLAARRTCVWTLSVAPPTRMLQTLVLRAHRSAVTARQPDLQFTPHGRYSEASDAVARASRGRHARGRRHDERCRRRGRRLRDHRRRVSRHLGRRSSDASSAQLSLIGLPAHAYLPSVLAAATPYRAFGAAGCHAKMVS
jgi:hypothetical protein